MLVPCNGLFAMLNPYAGTMYLERQTDWGFIVVTPPQNYPVPDGYRFEYPAKCFE